MYNFFITDECSSLIIVVLEFTQSPLLIGSSDFGGIFFQFMALLSDGAD